MSFEVDVKQKYTFTDRINAREIGVMLENNENHMNLVFDKI